MAGQDELPERFRPNDPTASDRATTDRTNVTFTLKEGGDKGLPLWITIEEYAPGLPVLTAGNGHLGLVFREGVTFEEAKGMAAQMRRMLACLTYTKLIT